MFFMFYFFWKFSFYLKNNNSNFFFSSIRDSFELQRGETDAILQVLQKPKNMESKYSRLDLSSGNLGARHVR